MQTVTDTCVITPLSLHHAPHVRVYCPSILTQVGTNRACVYIQLICFVHEAFAKWTFGNFPYWHGEKSNQIPRKTKTYGVLTEYHYIIT